MQTETQQQSCRAQLSNTGEFPHGYIFLQGLLRSPVFTSAAILALIEAILLLKNSASSSQFDAENCRQVGAVLSSWSIVEDNIQDFPAFCNSVIIL